VIGFTRLIADGQALQLEARKADAFVSNRLLSVSVRTPGAGDLGPVLDDAILMKLATMRRASRWSLLT
jgi:hypothetical protein